MKTLPTVAAAMVVAALLLGPMASAATGTLTITSPAAGSSFKGSEAYTISGTVSPAPTGADGVSIVVSNPSGTVVDQGNVPVTNGAWSYSTAVGNTASPGEWPTGQYTITAMDTVYGASATVSFTYTSTSAATYNVTRALINIQGNLTLIQNELKSDQAYDKNIMGNLTTLSQTVTGMNNVITTMSGTIQGLNSAVQQATTAAQHAETAANNANSAVSSTQTYVLVVAVLAAITLVLELAILVRKLS